MCVQCFIVEFMIIIVIMLGGVVINIINVVAEVLEVFLMTCD